jgi:hypothetical protein
MDNKKLIERNLPFTNKYIYMDITRGSIESNQFCTCDNCGKLITNMVHVIQKDNNKRFTIGTDCAETLAKAKCLYNNGQSTDFWLDIYAYNQAARFITEVKKGAAIDNNGYFASITTAKGKLLTIPTMQLQKFFPQYL